MDPEHDYIYEKKENSKIEGFFNKADETNSKVQRIALEVAQEKFNEHAFWLELLT